DHLGAGNLGLRILDVVPEGGLVPGEAGALVRGRIRIALDHTGLAAEQRVQHRPDHVLGCVADLMTGSALQERLFARARVLRLGGPERRKNESKRQQERAHQDPPGMAVAGPEPPMETEGETRSPAPGARIGCSECAPRVEKRTRAAGPRACAMPSRALSLS